MVSEECKRVRESEEMGLIFSQEEGVKEVIRGKIVEFSGGREGKESREGKGNVVKGERGDVLFPGR